MKLLTIALVLSFILTGCASNRFQKRTENMLNSDGTQLCSSSKIKVFDVSKGKVESTWKARCGDETCFCKEKLVSNTKTIAECSNTDTSHKVESTVENK